MISKATLLMFKENKLRKLIALPSKKLKYLKNINIPKQTIIVTHNKAFLPALFLILGMNKPAK